MFNVKGFPSIFFFLDGEMKFGFSGARVDALEQAVEKIYSGVLISDVKLNFPEGKVKIIRMNNHFEFQLTFLCQAAEGPVAEFLPLVSLELPETIKNHPFPELVRKIGGVLPLSNDGPEGQMKIIMMLQLEFMPAQAQAKTLQDLTQMTAEMKSRMRVGMMRQFHMIGTMPGAALLDAVKTHNKPLAKFLLETLHADVNYVAPQDGNNSLMWAAWINRPDLVELLIEHKATLTHSNHKKQNCLHWATMSNDVISMRLMLERKADVNALDQDGYSMAISAAQYGHTPILQYLKSHGADIFAKDSDDRTCLHWAAYKGEMVATEWLVAQGFALDAKDTKGRCPLHWAASADKGEIVKFMLLEYPGAYVTMQDAEGRTPYQVAEMKKSARAMAAFDSINLEVKKNSGWVCWEKIFCQNRYTMTSTRNEVHDFGRKSVMWFWTLMLLSMAHVIVLRLGYDDDDVIGNWRLIFLLVCGGLTLIFFALVNLTDPGFIKSNQHIKTKIGGTLTTALPMPLAAARENEKDIIGESKVSVLGGGSSGPIADPSTPVAPRSDSKDVELGQGARAPLADPHTALTYNGLTYEECLKKGYLECICVTCAVNAFFPLAHFPGDL